VHDVVQPERQRHAVVARLTPSWTSAFIGASGRLWVGCRPQTRKAQGPRMAWSG